MKDFRMDSLLAHDIYSVPRTQDVQLLENVFFKDMFFSESLIRSLTENGFLKPSPIQHKAIPLARCGFDLIVKSKSGTGKTLVFALAALESLDVSLNRVQVIILTPTREIALQVTQVLRALSKHIKDVAVETFIGGLPLLKDISAAKRCHIAIGAPGRVKQLIELRYINTEAVRLFILDEADQLMAKSFQNDINFIYWSLSEFKQMMALSATFPVELVSFLGKYLRRGRLVTPDTDPIPVLKGLKQFVSLTRNHPDPLVRLKEQESRLLSVLTNVMFTQCIVFSNYQTRAESTCNMLRRHGWSSEWISGKMPQEQRLRALTELKERRCRILVTTNLTARGIDSKGIDLVVNLDIPYDPYIYLHRMGRAGRFGSLGVVITILSYGRDLDKFLIMLGRIDKRLSVKVIPKKETYNLWSDDINYFNCLYGVASEEFTDVLDNKEISTEEIFKEESSNSSKEYNDKLDTNIPPDLNQLNFPVIPSQSNFNSLNDHFLLPSEPEPFLSLDSLQNSLKTYNVNKENVNNLSMPKAQLKNNNTDLYGSDDCLDSVKKEKQVSYVSKQPLKEMINSNPTMQFSYSDIAKGKRVEFKTVTSDGKETLATRLKKSPLKVFPGEKVSCNIEGITISDKARDGFSKRMYSCVVKGNFPKNITNNKTIKPKAKPLIFDSFKSKPTYKGQKVEDPITFLDTFITGNLSQIDETNFLPDNSESILKSPTPKEKEITLKDTDTLRKTNSLHTGLNIMAEPSTDIGNDVNKMKNLNSKKSGIEEIQAHSSMTIPSFDYRSSCENLDIKNITKLLYDSRITDLSSISTNDENQTIPESLTCDLSQSDGEDVLSRSLGYDESYIPHDSSPNRSLSGDTSEQNNLSHWLQMYRQQSSLIYNYILYAKHNQS